MKVILLEELRGKGGEGDVIEVAQGYAENFLFPQGIAVAATSGNLKQLEQRRHNIEKRELARTNDAQTIKNAVEGKTVTIAAKVGEEGQLFGSITNTMVADAVLEQLGVTVDRKKIEIKSAIKTAGEHEVEIAIYREIGAVLTVLVADQKEIEAAQKTEAPAEEAEETEEAQSTPQSYIPAEDRATNVTGPGQV